MLICSCNIVTREEIRSTINALLDKDPWQLIVPTQVYHEMGKRGRCCGCFPNLVDLIVETVEVYHRSLNTDDTKVVEFIHRLKNTHEKCETARKLARLRLAKVNAA